MRSNPGALHCYNQRHFKLGFSAPMAEQDTAYDEASHQTVELGNRLADASADADAWDIADGLLAGAIQYWLFTRQPCGDRECEDCAPLCTADLRLEELKRIATELAQTSEYFHSPNDFDAGRA